jgi:hypothetical protein
MVLATGSPQVQTNVATNIQSNSAMLNGYMSDLGGYGTASVWFEWGTTTNYGTTTSSINQNYTGAFSQYLGNLFSGQVYHYRAVAQNSYGYSYGQDVAFTAGQPGNSQIIVNAGPNVYVNSGQAVILQGSAHDNSGGYITYSWSCTGGSLSQYNIAQPTYTAPYLNQYNNQANYTCTLTANNNFGQSNSSATTIYVNSYNNNNTLNVQTNSATYTYNNQATLNGYISSSNAYNVYGWFQWGLSSSYGYESNHQPLQYSGTFNQNIANLIANQMYHYRAVAQDNYGNISYGQDMTFTSTGYAAYNPPPTQYGPGYYGSTNVSTGLTNDFLKDSFFLPLVVLIAGLWLWRSGIFAGFLHWIALHYKNTIN